MQDLSMERAKAVYRAAIDSGASDFEEPAWWEAVRAEMAQVLSARSVHAAAAVIAWWHWDWSAVGDTARDAAGRIRRAAKTPYQPCLNAKRQADEA